MTGREVNAASVAAGAEVSIHKDDMDTSAILWAEESVVLNPGVKFATKVPGKVTKIKVYTSAEQGGVHTVCFWDDETKEMLAGPFEWDITPGTEGWKEFTLPKAINIEAEHFYMASVSNHEGFMKFCFTNKYFANYDPDSIFIMSGSSGMFGVGATTYPVNAYDSRTYYRDVVFVPDEDFGDAGGPGEEIVNPETDETKTIYGDLKDAKLHAATENVKLYMGTRFATKKSGTITAVKLYTAVDEKASDRQVYLYDGYTGDIIAGPYDWTTKGLVEGWQYFILPEAVKIEAWHDYLVVVTTDEETPRYFMAEAYYNESNYNGEMFISYPNSGVFAMAETFPELTYNNRAYLRDVVFLPDDEEVKAPAQDSSLAEKQSVYLSDLKMGQGFSYYTPVVFDGVNEFESIYIAQTAFNKGITMYACTFEGGAFAEFNIEGLGMKTFAAYVGVTEAVGIDTYNSTVEFVVYLDGVEIQRSPVLHYEDPIYKLSADITGGKILRLVVNCGEDGNFGDMGAWGDAALSKLTDFEAIYKDLEAAGPTTPPAADPTEEPSASATATPAPTKKPDGDAAEPAEKDNTTLIVTIVVVIIVAIAGVAAILVIKAKRRNE